VKHRVLTLLLDYHRRTLGVWVLVVFVQLMQMSAVWVLGIRHVPIVGAVIASLVFCATWDSPHIVMRTLPIETRELAILRWWERIGMPMLFITLGYVLAWFSNEGTQFPTPPFLGLWLPVAGSFATLGIFSVLPLPMLSAQRSNAPVFVVVWIALAIGGLFGVPLELLPEPLPLALLICGVFLALVSLSLARSGRVLQLPPVSRFFTGWRTQRGAVPVGRSRFRGWPVLFLQWARTTALFAFASVVVISLVRPHVHFFQQALPWIFVSVTGAVGTVLARRWLRSVRALQCMPIRSATLAFIVCVVLMAPVVVTSLVATAVSAIVPAWGITVPLYMVPVFAIVPALQMTGGSTQTSHAVPSAIQQWAPIMQIVAWPLWTGAFMSMELTRLMPAGFEIIAVAAAVVLAVVAYGIVLYRIRSGMGLERMGDPLTPR
jgi:hypothetical protein